MSYAFEVQRPSPSKSRNSRVAHTAINDRPYRPNAGYTVDKPSKNTAPENRRF
jgi:hypothetical protein